MQLSVDHNFRTTSGVSLGDYTPYGTLKSPSRSDGEVEYKNTVVVFNSLAADMIPLPTLLLAASEKKGVMFDLDDIANDYLNADNDPDFQRLSFREFGVVLLFVVSYNNIKNYWSGCVRNKNPCYEYTYEPAIISTIDDFAQDTYYSSYPSNRTDVIRRGIRIVGVLSGEIGFFDFQTLLIQLTTSLALLKIATTLVDLVAIKLLPRRKLYHIAKFEMTQDFSDLAKAQHEEKRKTKEPRGLDMM